MGDTVCLDREPRQVYKPQKGQIESTRGGSSDVKIAATEGVGRTGYVLGRRQLREKRGWQPSPGDTGAEAVGVAIEDPLAEVIPPDSRGSTHFWVSCRRPEDGPLS